MKRAIIVALVLAVLSGAVYAVMWAYNAFIAGEMVSVSSVRIDNLKSTWPETLYITGSLQNSSTVVKRIETMTEGDTLYVSVVEGLRLFSHESGDINYDTGVSSNYRIVLTGKNGEQRILWDKNYRPYDIKALTVWNKENFDGKLVDAEGKETGARAVSFDKSKIETFIKSATYSDDFFVWKGGYTGLLEYEVSDSTIIRISNYGAFFIIDNVKGAFVIEQELANDWKALLRDFSYAPEADKLKQYNKTIYVEQDNANYHPLFRFNDDEYFLLCWHKGNVVQSDNLIDYINLKYALGIKLVGYLADRDLKLLYEDGTYIEWSSELYTIKYLVDTKE